MSAVDDKKKFIAKWAQKCVTLLYERNNLTTEELGEVMQKVEKLKDERLKELVARLIGWGEEERSELKFFCAVAVEVMKETRPSGMRDAMTRVELRFFQEQEKQKHAQTG